MKSKDTSIKKVKRINKWYKSIKVKRSNKESPLKLIVREWRTDNQEGSKAQCHRETGISRPTIDKYWKSGIIEETESGVEE